MTANAIIGFGATLTKGGDAVAELTSITGPSQSADTMEVTSHDSSDNYKEYLIALLEAGEVSIEGYFYPGDAAGQITMHTDFQARSKISYVITLSDTTTTWGFDAFITAFETSAPFDGPTGFSATLKITGKPTLAITASAGLTTTFFAISESAVIVPDPANDTYEYVATVLTTIESVTVTPIAAAGVITVDGNVVVTEQASSAITLGDAGTVTDITIVVTETGETPVTYTIHVARAAAG